MRKCSANESIGFRLVRTKTDINRHRDEPFRPKFTHQIFANQVIRGYREVTAEIFFNECTLEPFLRVRVKGKDKDDADDVKTKLNEWMVGGFTSKIKVRWRCRCAELRAGACAWCAFGMRVNVRQGA